MINIEKCPVCDKLVKIDGPEPVVICPRCGYFIREKEDSEME